MSDFFTKRICANFKENSSLGWKTKSVGRNIEVTLWGYKNKKNNWFHLFDLKIIWVHVFFLNFSQVCIFCGDNNSKLLPESTQPGSFPSWTIVDNLAKNSKFNIYYYNERFMCNSCTSRYCLGLIFF